MSAKSQAGTVLVLAAGLDEHLQKLLLAKCALSNEMAKRIFKGSLRSFAAKIDIAYAFDVIDEELHDDLTIIRDIRNEFAHSLTEIHFGRPEIDDLVKKFKQRDASLDPFLLFQQKVQSCAGRIEGKLNRILYENALRNDDLPRSGG